MNFTDYTALLPELRAQHPKALDLTETRVTKALADLAIEAFVGLKVPEVGYRCHIAKAWQDRLPPLVRWPNTVLVSAGVRHALAVLFREWAAQGLKAALPIDVYPVYLQLADAAGLQYRTYSAHAEGAFSDLEDVDVALVANPVKPRGTHLSFYEHLELMEWLMRDEKRRVVVDAVYDLTSSLAGSTESLLLTRQAILLHSLSKGWLAPLRAGAVVVPPQDVAFWTPVFRAEPVDRSKLAEAEALLTQRPDFPRKVQQVIGDKAEALHSELRRRGIEPCEFAGDRAASYLVCVEGSWKQTLEKGVLGLPMTSFGGTNLEVTVLSALSLPN